MARSEYYVRGRDRWLVALAVVILAVTLDFVRRVATGDVLVTDVATFLWDGTILGLVIGLAGVGLSMTYSILNFANFSHGDLLTAGAFAGWATSFVVAGTGSLAFGELVLLGGASGVDVRTLGISATATPVAVVLGLLVAAVATALLALVVDRLVYRPMRGQEGISLLIASIGVALAIRYLVVFVFQAGTRGLTSGAVVPSMTLSVGAGSLNADLHEVVLVVAAGALMLGVHLLLQRTKLGTAMRAMADNADLAQITGIPTERVVRATWLVGGSTTGAAGYLVALERGTLNTDLGWTLLLLIFAAVILGGIGSVYGAMAGGVIIGLASRLALVWIPPSFLTAAAFAVMIVVLLVRPSGLFEGVTTA